MDQTRRMKWNDPETALGHSAPDSSIQGIVVVHAVLLVLSSLVANAWPNEPFMPVVCSAVVLSQTMLLLIWMNLSGEPTAGKVFLIAGHLLLAFVVHSLRDLAMALGFHFGAGLIIGLLFLAGIWIPVVAFGCAIFGLPLAVARSEGLRLRHFPADDMPTPQPFQFRLAHMLWATALMAILFALGQLAEIGAKSPGSIQTARAVAELATFLVGLAIVLSIPLVGVWAVLTPGSRVPRMATALFGWGLAALLIAHYNRGRPDVFFYFGPTLLVATALVLLTLARLHRLGYRVIWTSNEGEGRSPFAKEPDL